MKMFMPKLARLPRSKLWIDFRREYGTLEEKYGASRESKNKNKDKEVLMKVMFWWGHAIQHGT